MRTSTIARKTKETDVKLSLNIDGRGNYNIRTDIKFFNHLLSSFAKHGSFDLKLKASGDNEHHVVEDVAIALGEAFKRALGSKRGIRRFGFAIVPMDDVLLLSAIDIGGRAYSSIGVKFRRKKIEDLSAEMISHFLATFVSESRINLHAKLLEGRNEHHIAEALFKSLALSLRDACTIAGRGIPSTKGVV
ncbi:MAG: imidazoleglycerol-phosphate dehydratase HisB [Methanobacteriota archaeon]